MTLPAANWEQNSDRSGPRVKMFSDYCWNNTVSLHSWMRKTPEIGKSWRVIYFFPLFYQKVRSLPLQIFICLSTILVAHIRLCVDIKPSLRFDCHFWFCSRCDGKTLWCLCEVCISLFGDCRDDTAQLQGPEVDLYFQGKSGKCSPNSVVNEYAWIL